MPVPGARLASAAALVLLSVFSSPVHAQDTGVLLPATRVQPASWLDAGARVRITISAVLTAKEIVALVGPSLPTDALEWHRQTVTVRSGGRPITEVPRPGRRLVGSVISSDDRSVFIRVEPADEPLVVPRGSIVAIERSAGALRRGRHALVGLAVGAGAGALLALVHELSCDPDTFFSCMGPGVALGGALLGSGAGALIGTLRPPEDRWVAADLSAQIVPVVGTGESAGDRPRAERITVTIGTGAAVTGGPAGDLEGAMRAAGYESTSAGCLFSCPDEPIRYPRSRRGLFDYGRPVRVDASYRITRAWAIHARWQRTPIGQTTGRTPPPANYLDVTYRLTTAGVVMSRSQGPFRLGAGPAWHRAATRRDLFGRSWSPSASRIGYLAEAGLRLPASTRVFFDVTVQYAGVGHITVGPYVPRYPSEPLVELPATNASFSHWFVGMGGGVRF